MRARAISHSHIVTTKMCIPSAAFNAGGPQLKRIAMDVAGALNNDYIGVTLVIPTIGAIMTSPVATTLKIAADLKRRVVAAAKAADKSPHAFMLEAIEHQTRLDEQRRAFVADAVAARSETLTSGDGYASADVHRYLAARVRGDRAKRPKIRTWRK
jgi:predicted transcriptional regulator